MIHSLRKFRIHSGAIVIAALIGALSAPVHAQVNAEIANCEELKDSVTQSQIASCSAHIGCNMVLKLQKDCTKAKGFLSKLQDALSGRSEITSNDVFEANTPTLMPSPALRSQVSIVQKIIRDAANDPTNVKVAYKCSVQQCYYEGALSDGKRHGVGVTIADHGLMERGQYKNNILTGQAQTVMPIGSIFVSGNYGGGKLSGSGVWQSSDRVVGVGTWDTGKLVGMWDYTYPSGNTNKVLYDADGRWLATGPQAPPGQIAQALFAERDERVAKLDKMSRETEKLRQENAAAAKKAEEDRARDRRETFSLLGKAAAAAAGGQTGAERRQLAINALAGNEPSAVGSNSGVLGASGSSSSGGTVGATEMVPLSPPGNAKSRNECLKLTWATSPLPIPKSWNGLDEHYRNKDMLRSPDYFGRSSNGDRAEQKHLVATSACTEDLIVIVFSCAEHTMLSTGSAPIPSSRRGDKYSWSAGAHTATGFDGFDGLNFTTSDPTSLYWVDLHIAKELVIKNQYGSSLYDARRHIVKVFYGAWLRSDITNEKSHGPRSNINLWTESFLKTLTANGKELARKQEAVNKKGREVLGMDQNPESDHDKRKDPVFLGGGNGGGKTRGYPAPDPDWLKLGVKTCGAFTAEEVWNATR